jgi:hypothetical protein
MGKIKDEIEYRKRAKFAKTRYLEMNFERMILLITSAIMGCDMKNDDMGNIIITSQPVGDKAPCTTVLSFDAGMDGFNEAFQNIAMVQDYFKDEIAKCLAKDKPFDTFYDGFHQLMADFYTERLRDDDDWQLNNAKNLVCKSSRVLQQLYNDRPDKHSGCKESAFFGALLCMGHYLRMPKMTQYMSHSENCYPVNIFNKQNKSMPPLTVGIEIDMCDRFKKLNKPTVAELVEQGLSPVEAVEQGGYSDSDEKGAGYVEYYDLIKYLGISDTISVDIPEYKDENFWHTRRLREYFKSM